MYKFSARSQEQLATCHPDLQYIFKEVIKLIDITILEGYRGEDAQYEAYRKGLSKLRFPQSKHNSLPSRAIDVAPYPIDWKDLKRFAFLYGVVFAIAERKGIKIRCGMDWDRDLQFKDETFMDAVHFELVGE